MTEHDFIKAHRELKIQIDSQFQRLENQLIEQNRAYAIDTNARREQLGAMENKLQTVIDQNAPVYSLYMNASTFAKWIKRFIMFIAVVLGLLLSWKQLQK